jgi:hypothetical protein
MNTRQIRDVLRTSNSKTLGQINETTELTDRKPKEEKVFDSIAQSTILTANMTNFNTGTRQPTPSLERMLTPITSSKKPAT